MHGNFVLQEKFKRLLLHFMKQSLLFVFTMFLIACTGSSQEFQGVVTHVRDGDTFEMILDHKKVVVRVNGIDCPEKGQPFGKEARQFTDSLCMNEQVKLVVHGKDKYKRILATVILPSGKILNEELLESGMAWHFKKYNNSEHYHLLEQSARKKAAGLWNSRAPVAPWEYRRPQSRKNKPNAIPETN